MFDEEEIEETQCHAKSGGAIISYELREDGGYELREDGGKELR